MGAGRSSADLLSISSACYGRAVQPIIPAGQSPLKGKILPVGSKKCKDWGPSEGIARGKSSTRNLDGQVLYPYLANCQRIPLQEPGPGALFLAGPAGLLWLPGQEVKLWTASKGAIACSLGSQ